MFGRIEVDNIAKWIHGDTIDEGSYGPNPKEGCGGGRGGERERGSRREKVKREKEREI